MAKARRSSSLSGCSKVSMSVASPVIGSFDQSSVRPFPLGSCMGLLFPSGGRFEHPFLRSIDAPARRRREAAQPPPQVAPDAHGAPAGGRPPPAPRRGASAAQEPMHGPLPSDGPPDGVGLPPDLLVPPPGTPP